MNPMHFMRDDIFGVALATLLFGLFFVPPGFVIAWLFDLLDFRKASLGWQAAVGLALSVAIVPGGEFVLWTYAGISAVWVFHAIAGLVSGWLIFRGRRRALSTWIVIAALGWLAIVWLSGIDLQVGNRLFPSVLVYDFNLRSALIDSITRLGLPATNPLYFPGHSVLLRYHYFWFLPCSLVDRLGGSIVSARHTLIASDVWCGWALMAVVPLALRYLHPAGERALERRTKWAILLLAIAGLDVVPNLLFDAIFSTTGAGLVFPSSEWWNNPVTGFPHAVLWVSHHIASVIACFVGFLLLWRSNGKIASAMCAGLCFASATGLSIYVTLTFAMFLVPCGFVMLWRKSWPVRVCWLTAGATVLAATSPYLLAMRTGGGASTGSFLMFTVRSMTFVDIIMPSYGLNWNQVAWVNLAVLPLNYFLETGVAFVLAGIWLRRVWRRKHLRESEGVALGMIVTALFVATFLRSGVIINNDLAWRGALIGQLILVIWSAGPLSAWWRIRRRRGAGLVTGLVVLGLASSVYEVIILRTYFPLMEARKMPIVSWFSKTVETGRRTYDARSVYAQLARDLPKDAVLQGNPTHWGDIYHGSYAERQTAAFDSLCGAVMGGDPASCGRMQSEVGRLFVEDGDIDRACDAWKIQVLVAKDDDAVFQNHSAWPWTRPTLAESEHVRAVRCGSK